MLKLILSEWHGCGPCSLTVRTPDGTRTRTDFAAAAAAGPNCFCCRCRCCCCSHIATVHLRCTHARAARILERTRQRARPASVRVRNILSARYRARCPKHGRSVSGVYSFPAQRTENTRTLAIARSGFFRADVVRFNWFCWRERSRVIAGISCRRTPHFHTQAYSTHSIIIINPARLGSARTMANQQ